MSDPTHPAFDLTPTDVIDRAIDKLHTSGWCRGSRTNVQGQVCLMGAIGTLKDEHLEKWPVAFTSGWEHWQSDPNAEAYRHVHSITHTATRITWRVVEERCNALWGGNIPIWNDRVARDADEVIEVLKLARERAEMGEQ